MTSNDELTCKEVVKLVTAYLEHALLPEMRKRFDEHLAECPSCETYLEQMQFTIGMLHQLAAEPVFPATKQELLQTFRNWKQDMGMVKDLENKEN